MGIYRLANEFRVSIIVQENDYVGLNYNDIKSSRGKCIFVGEVAEDI